MSRPVRTLVVASLLGALLIAAAPSANAAGSYTFYGSGNGHGLGLSQYGSKGLAQMGWAYGRILTHFYQRTKVVSGSSLPKTIRVNLTYDRSIVHLGARGGPVRLKIGKKVIATIPMDKTWTVRAKASGYAIRDGAGKLVGRKTWGGPGYDLVVTYANTGSRVFIPEADAIWGRGFTYGRGSIRFDLYACGGGGCLERLNLWIGLEDYLVGLGEVPPSWPVESLKAQVVAARSYAVSKIRASGVRSECNCHLYDGSSDQVYVGYEREVGSYAKRWMNAVKATAHKVVTYRGAVIQAFYAASDGGYSENVEDVWHGGNPAYAIPYLRGVCDPGEAVSGSPYTSWNRRFTASELGSRLSRYVGSIGAIKGIPRIRRGESGRIVSLTVRGPGGTGTVSGSELRSALVLPDTRVWINSNRTITGRIRSKYDGLMCAPGLPTSPVLSVAGGSRQKFRTGGIFRNERADVTVWLRGAIYKEYGGVGGLTGKVGMPTSAVRAISAKTAAGAGRRIDFETGSIWFKKGVGAHALWGRVRSAYLAKGGSGGALGYPITRARVRSDGTMSATFEHGAITCPTGSPCVVS
jgi:stage II sporulation protein D